MALLNSRKCLVHILKNTVILRPRVLNADYQLRFLSADTDAKQESTSDVDSKLKIDLDKANEQITLLKQQCEDLNDKYKRSIADSVNLRARMLDQIEDAKLYGIQNFCKDLLDVADVLDTAVKSVPTNEVSDKNPHLKNLYEGLLMIGTQLNKVFKKNGLEPLNPINLKFDPNFHEALFQHEIKGKTSGTVIDVSKIGYKLHNRVIRPALVGVAK